MSSNKSVHRIAIVGTGVIGANWAELSATQAAGMKL